MTVNALPTSYKKYHLWANELNNATGQTVAEDPFSHEMNNGCINEATNGGFTTQHIPYAIKSHNNLQA